MTTGVCYDVVQKVLEDAFKQAEECVKHEKVEQLANKLNSLCGPIADQVAQTDHNGRGVALTLAACKAANVDQQVAFHQRNHQGGFNARSVDEDVVVPFLRARSLPNPSQSHWLTASVVAQPFTPNLVIKTQSKKIKENLPQLVCELDKRGDEQFARQVLHLILVRLIEERNKSHVPLTKPKGLIIDTVISLLRKHFSQVYKHGAPRLPQLAMYALFDCLVESCDRYKDAAIGELERLRAANRKSGTVGDVDIYRDERPIEAVEVKFDKPIKRGDVTNAIEKIKTSEVERYYLVSTQNMDLEEEEEIRKIIQDFYYHNGCELIVNGVYETIKYGLRSVTDIDTFVAKYVDLLGSDLDVGYEHREAWNEVVQERLG